jgi:hypothetical protein
MLTQRRIEAVAQHVPAAAFGARERIVEAPGVAAPRRDVGHAGRELVRAQQLTRTAHSQRTQQTDDAPWQRLADLERIVVDAVHQSDPQPGLSGDDRRGDPGWAGPGDDDVKGEAGCHVPRHTATRLAA